MAKQSPRKLKSAARAIDKVAARQGVTAEEVRWQIEQSIHDALSHHDPQAQAFWERMPKAGDVPTPEELIAFCADEVSKGR